MNKYTPEHDEDWFREQYLEKKLSTTKIAEETDLTPEGVRERLERYGIERRQPNTQKLHDAEWLREQYQDKKKSPGKIADRLGCGRSTVYRWLENHSIERVGKSGFASSRPASYFVGSRGYPVWSDTKSGEMYPVHRLLAIAENGVDAVKDNHIHHVNGVRYDNRPENIEVLSPSEHIKRHNEERAFDQSRDEMGRFEPLESSCPQEAENDA